MLAVAKFKKTVFECGCIAKSVLYEHIGLFLVVVTSKIRFLLSFCKFLYKFRNFVWCEKSRNL